MHGAFMARSGLALIAAIWTVPVAADDPGAGSATIPVIIRLYGPGELPQTARAVPQEVAAGILRRARVPITWLDCALTLTGPAGPQACVESPGPRELIVRLIRAPGSNPTPALGYSLIDVDQQRGWMATVYVDRVDGLAEATGTNRHVLLGRAIAHEVTHLLLGTTRHSALGLMRANWSPTELVRYRPWDWRLTDRDAQLVHAAYLARMARPGTPPTRLAELLAAPAGPTPSTLQ